MAIAFEIYCKALGIVEKRFATAAVLALLECDSTDKDKAMLRLQRWIDGDREVRSAIFGTADLPETIHIGQNEIPGESIAELRRQAAKRPHGIKGTFSKDIKGTPRKKPRS